MSTQVTVVDEVRNGLQAMQPQFRAALPAHVTPEKFMRVTMTAIQTNPDLLKADRRTLYGAAMRAAQQGLLPDGREGAIVTFGNTAQWMPMLGGILKLARNSGEISSIDAQIVYKADKFSYRPGIDLVPVHEPDWFGDRGDIVGAYAVARIKDGAAYVEIMSKKQIEQVRNVSRAKNSGPWVSWWDEMARKTVLRRLSKRLPMSTDLDEVIRADDELFQPPAETPAEPAPTNGNGHAAPHAPKTRASRLQKVADQAPPAHDEDGVIIDMPAGAPPPDQYDGPDEDASPI